MAARLPEGPREGERQLSVERRSVSPYCHEDAMRSLLHGDAAAISRAIGLAARTVRQWQERYDTDHRGPGRTLAVAIRSALELGRTDDDCAEVLRAVLADTALPYRLAPLVLATKVDGHDVDRAGLVAVREAADAAARASELCRDGLTPAERIEAKREVRQAIDQLLTLDAMLDLVPEQRR